jgi:hypothetical protein
MERERVAGYAINEYSGEGGGATHEITVEWGELEVRPPFLPPGAIIDLGSKGAWRVIEPIHSVPMDGYEESFTYLVEARGPRRGEDE